jgi:hypothetical protein
LKEIVADELDVAGRDGGCINGATIFTATRYITEKQNQTMPVRRDPLPVPRGGERSAYHRTL